MAGALVSGIRAYTSAIKAMPYSQSMFAQALGDPSKFRFSLNGEYTAYRVITGETAGNYDGTTGFNAGPIDLDVWAELRAEFDRSIAFAVDYISELNTILSGMTLTGTEKLKASWRRLGPEIDAVSCATIYNQIPASNQIVNTTAGYKTDADNIVQTLINMDNNLFDLGWYGDVAVMLASNIAGYLSQAIIQFNGLASGAMLAPVTSQEVTRRVNFRGQDYFDGGLHLTYEVLRFQNRMFIYKVPRQCMVSNVVLLDKVSDGQVEGGWIPDTDADGFHSIDMMVIPVDAAAVSVRHVVSSMTVPLAAYNIDKFNVNNELSALNDIYDGQVVVENIGIDQTGDRFKYMNRIKYGAVVFEGLAHLIYAVYNTTAATAAVTGVAVNDTAVGPGGGSVIVTATGTNMVGAIAQLFDSAGTAKVGKPVALSGSGTVQVGLLAIPANTSAAAVNYTVKVSIDNGDTWATQTATVTANK